MIRTTDFRLKTKHRVMLVYSKALYIYTLADEIVTFVHNANIKEFSCVEITVYGASFGVLTAIPCLRLGIGVGHRNM